MSNLTPELQKQIEQEAESDASSYGYAPGTEVDEDLQSVYRYAAGKYAEKWQAAEARADRYEKALKRIAEYSKTSEEDIGEADAAYGYDVIIERAREALTPKQPTDDTVNG